MAINPDDAIKAMNFLEARMRDGYIFRMQQYEKGKYILYGTNLHPDKPDLSCTGKSLIECLLDMETDQGKEVKL